MGTTVPGITGSVALTSIGRFARTIPYSDFGVIAQHPGDGPVITIQFYDTYDPGVLLGTIVVGQNSRKASCELVSHGLSVDLSYVATVADNGTIANPGAFFTIYEDMGDEAHIMAHLPSYSPASNTIVFGDIIQAPVYEDLHGNVIGRIDISDPAPTSTADPAGSPGDSRLVAGSLYFKDPAIGWLTLPMIQF